MNLTSQLLISHFLFFPRLIYNVKLPKTVLQQEEKTLNGDILKVVAALRYALKFRDKCQTKNNFQQKKKHKLSKESVIDNTNAYVDTECIKLNRHIFS